MVRTSDTEKDSSNSTEKSRKAFISRIWRSKRKRVQVSIRGPERSQVLAPQQLGEAM